MVHDLRRSAAQAMVQSGIAEKVAMEIGGWKTRSVFDRYAIVSQSDMRAAIEKREVHAREELEKEIPATCTVQ